MQRDLHSGGRQPPDAHVDENLTSQSGSTCPNEGSASRRQPSESERPEVINDLESGIQFFSRIAGPLMLIGVLIAIFLIVF